MASLRQKRAAEQLAKAWRSGENPTGAQIVENSGYSKTMRLYPGRILESKGVKHELKLLGFSVEAADSVIWYLLHKGKREDTKLRAAQEIYKRLGAYEDTKQGAAKVLSVTISEAAANKYGIQATNETPSGAK